VNLISNTTIQAKSDLPPAKRNLVLGTAWGLELEDLLLFSKSLRRVAPAADVVLLSKDATGEAQRLAVNQRIQLLPLTSCYFGLCKSSAKRVRRESLKRIRNYVGLKLVRGLAGAAYPLLRIGYTKEECRQLRRELGKLVIHTYSSRFLQYLDFLRNQGAQYDKVMLTDVRDVCFQADPFARIPSDQLWMFQEQGPATLGTEPRNRRWVEAAFGKKVLRQIAHQHILCAGITIGSFRNILGYLEVMEPELLSRTPVYIPDQGIHNALAYTGAFNHLNPVIVKNGDGPVLTVGMMNDAQMTLDGAGRLVDPAGNPYAVIHQYDRHPRLIPIMKKLAG
jgi:hypothetical protein